MAAVADRAGRDARHGFGPAALVVAAIGTRYGGGAPRYTNDLLDQPGLRPGVIGALLLILPMAAFLGQCTRIGVLRPAGATPRQVRRISPAAWAA